MLAILSPAKNMKPASSAGVAVTRPLFGDRADYLAEQLKACEPWQLESLMKISPSLALRACLDYQGFEAGGAGTPALATYQGLAFRYLGAEELEPADYAFGGDHLRILSALYGLLRPADGIQPYRLEMQCRIKIEGRDLYAFWGDRLYRELFRAGEPVVNLASAEYARTVTPYLRPADRLITCRFLTMRRGRLIMPATGAKMARGRMARWILQRRLDTPEELKAFDWEGYAYCGELSDDTTYTYIQG